MSDRLESGRNFDMCMYNVYRMQAGTLGRKARWYLVSGIAVISCELRGPSKGKMGGLQCASTT